MGHDDRREIFERLDALERMVRSRHEDRRSCEHDHHGEGDRWQGDHHHHHDHDHGDGDFQEKRIIDTIVRLVAEQVGRVIEDRQAKSRGGGDGDEKRIVDLIVGLVAEKVHEIVAEELDRRLGRPGGGRGAGSSEAE